MIASRSGAGVDRRHVVSALMAAILVAGMIPSRASAQEAPPPPELDGPSFFKEPGLLTSAIDFAGRYLSSEEGDDDVDDDGFYPKVGGFISGAGWISGGPGYRRHVLSDRAIIDATAEVSWRGYLQLNAVFEFPLLVDGRATTGVEAMWRDSTQVNYFGVGPDTPDLRSQYRLQTMNVVGYGQYRFRRWLALSGRLGWIDRPSVSSPTGPFRPDAPDAQATFPDDPAMVLAQQPMFTNGEIAITADTRDYPDHPTSGGLYRTSAGAYVADQRDFSFRRYEVEGLQALPLFEGLWVMLFRGWAVFADAASDQEMPFYLMPSLGSAEALRGYSNYRFHDRNLLLASAESRWAIYPHLDGAVFVDMGTVAPRVRDLGLDKTVYGFGFRVHTHSSTIARVDVAHNEEGWSVLYRSSDPMSLKRLKHWVAAIPFVP